MNIEYKIRVKKNNYFSLFPQDNILIENIENIKF